MEPKWLIVGCEIILSGVFSVIFAELVWVCIYAFFIEGKKKETPSPP